MTDLFLYNGLTPRRRSPGDLFLDNGLGLLSAYLRREGIDFILEDRVTLAGLEPFSLPETSRPLRFLFDQVVFGNGSLTRAQRKDAEAKIRSLYGELARHQSQAMDAYLQSLADFIAKDRTPVVGMKIWFGSTFVYCKQFCRMIHEASPETIVAVGGPHANCFYHEGAILQHSPFDLAVYSEGEAALAAIAKIARQYKTRKERLEAIAQAGIPNLVYRTPEGIRINPTVPLPINEKLIPEYNDLDHKIRSHTIIDALGCDYARCTFCVVDVLNVYQY